ncbi:MAG: glycoside hydrolase family 3 C-terminal domain-containing protein [Paludibacter sp.]|nr:glycoside hydrolase family 3 C-terminal domain-containing protein [Paludibacter sp.]
MKKITSTIISTLILACFLNIASAQKTVAYSFQNTRLSAEKRIENLVSLMTLDEKISAFGGGGIARLGVKGPGSAEAIHGVVLGGPAWDEKSRGPKQPTTVFPQGYGLGETWDTELLQKIAENMSHEARYLFQNPKYKKAGLILWAPNADLGRDIRWGRNEECYGEDAFLTGELVTAMVRGLQGNNQNYWRTASLMKHFLANSNEFGRTETSSNFDDALFREYYSYPFMRGITKGGSNALMTAYNAYNGIPCTIHPILKNILMKEWKFDGMIITDGGAFQQLRNTHKTFNKLEDAAKACINAGTTRFLDDYKAALTDAIKKGLVTEKELEPNIKGNLRIMLKLGLLDSSDKNPYSNIGIADTINPWEKAETKQLVRLAANKSVVLLKNDKQTLPLNKETIRRIAVIGNRADEVIEDWYSGTPAYKVSALQGIKNAVAGQNIEVRYARTNKMDEATKAAAWADVAIVCVGNEPTCSPDWGTSPWGKSVIAGEGREDVDRAAITLEQEDLIKLVYKANPNTVVALISSFPYAINWTQEHVPAILHITQSCQELGNAVADVLFGDYNPAGRTTQTWVSSMDQLPPMLDYDIRHGRTYMYSKEKPLYPFGFGLSYTTFEYSNLQVVNSTSKSNRKQEVSVDIENKGQRDGEEVVQLYVKFPGDTATKRLKGFCRMAIAKGEKKTIKMTLWAEDLKLWNNELSKFVMPQGEMEIQVGNSSEDIKLKRNFIAIN